MPEEWDEIRGELIRCARRKGLRRNLWSPEMPCDWNPTQVMNPEVGMPFTDAGAWELIATLLESGHAFARVELRKPFGDIGYETKVQLAPNLPYIYIKIQLRAGKIWGRSFHNDLEAPPDRLYGGDQRCDH